MVVIMKKITLFITLLFCVFLIGCSNKVVDLKVDDISICIDLFDISDYKFTAVNKDGTEEEISMSLNMFSAADQNKLYIEGTHQVTLNYEGIQKQFTITLEERKAISMKAEPSHVSAYVQEFEYEMVKFEIQYNDNTTEELVLSKDLLSNADIISLGKAGTYDITVEYEDVSATVTIELLPNEIPIEELGKDVVVYCITKKVKDKYQSVFYALGNKEFSGLQFKLSKSNQVQEYEIKNVNEKVYMNEEELVVSFVNSSNIKGKVELFTIEFTSNQQYRNFNMNFGMASKIVYIDGTEVKEITNNIFTFTR